MNNEEDIFAFVSEATSLVECYSGKIDNNHLLSTFVMLCKAILETEGLTPKERRRKLKEIIEMKVEE